MIHNVLLAISFQDVYSVLFGAAYIIVAIVVYVVDYGFRHGWFTPSDEACEQYRQRILRQQRESQRQV